MNKYMLGSFYATKLYASFKYVNAPLQWAKSFYKSLGAPMTKMTYTPLILLALVWPLSAHAGFCHYEDVPNLIDTIEIVPFPVPKFILGLTAEEYEAMGKEHEIRMKEYRDNSRYRTFVSLSFIVWMNIDCHRQIDVSISKEKKLEELGVRTPRDRNNADDVIIGKVVDMAYAGSGVEEIQKMAQNAVRQFLIRENRGERIRW